LYLPKHLITALPDNMEPENNEHENDEIQEDEDFLEEDDKQVEFVIDDKDREKVDLDEEMDDADAQGEGEQGKSEEQQDDSIQRFLNHTDAVYCVALHPLFDATNNANTLALSGGGDDKAYIWDASSGNQLFELSGHKDSVNSVGFNFDGKMVATGSLDGTVKVWETATGKLVSTLEGPQGDIEWMQWHPKGNFLVAGSADATAWMWLPIKSECISVFAGHSASVTCGTFTADGKQLLTGSEDATVKIWDPKTGQVVKTISGHGFHEAAVNCIQTTPSGLVVTGGQDNSSRISNISTGKVLGSLLGHEGSVEAIGVCNVLPLIATGSLDNKINIYDVNTLQLRTRCLHDDGVTRLIWHPTQPLMYSCSVDKTVRLWDGRSSECIRIFKGHQNVILDMAVSHDGNVVVTASDDHASLVFKV